MLTVFVAVIGGIAALELASAARRTGTATRTRALTRRPSRVLPNRLRAPLARSLTAAEIGVTPEDAVRLWLACAAGAVLVGSSVSPPLGVAAGVAIVVGAPVALRLSSGRRMANLVAALPGLLDQVAADLRGGGTVSGALDRIADGPGRLAPDLAAVRARTGLGLELVDSLSRWAAERTHPGFAEAAGALAVAATTGGRAATALTGLAASLRERLATVAEARSLSAQARASAVVVGAAPLAYLVFAAVVDPASITVLVGTTFGRLCLVVGLTLDGLAAIWMRRLLRFAS